MSDKQIFAKHLRQQMTDVEKRLWLHLRDRRLQGKKFRRQVPLGPYIADFVNFEQRLIVELDGGQHADQIDYDERRDAWLAREGFRVLRFWNNEVMTNLEGVLETIAGACHLPLTPGPSPARGEGKQATEG